MLHPRGCAGVLSCALAMLATWLSVAVEAARTHRPLDNTAALPPLSDDAPYGAADWDLPPVEHQPPNIVGTSIHDEWMEDAPPGPLFAESCAAEPWSWQWLPANVIYHSYMAGVHEPRMALVTFFDGDTNAYWDATLGGRAPLVRYGDRDPLRPQGWQLDFYGAAVSRLDAEHRQDLEAVDYVFGFPISYGVGQWQFKFGYFHISSHLGDERAIRVPGQLDQRINYVRDGLALGASYYPCPVWRVYWEAGWAFHRSGGARTLDTQFGTELAPFRPTGQAGAPFIALHGRLRQELGFGGDMAVQLGWMRRGELGQSLRFGVHYYNGKSSQFQFFNTHEHQLGLGLWYDF